jgi:hypothetical protein
MKNYLFTLLLLVSGMAFGQSATTSSSQAAITWDTQEVNVGDIPQNVPKEVTFEFTNTGTAPLIISNVRTSCGCTASSWTKDPILPGETATITATYNAKALGSFGKTVTVTSNAATPTVVLHIKGNVVVAQE